MPNTLWERIKSRVLFSFFNDKTASVDLADLGKDMGMRGMKYTPMAQAYTDMMNLAIERDTIYRDLERMVEDPTVATAIELYVDDAVQFSGEKGRSIWVESTDKDLEAEMNNRLSDLGIEDAINDWTNSTALYGDFFLRLDGEEKIGISAIDDSHHPADVERVDVNGKLIAFRVRGEEELYTPFDFVHFRIMGAYTRQRHEESPFGGLVVKEGGKKYRLTTKYGISIIANVRRPWMQLDLMEKAMIMARLARSPRTLYMLKMQDILPKDAKEFVKIYEEKLYKNRAIDSQDQKLKTSPMDIAFGEDIVLPIPSAFELTVQEIGKDISVKGIEDIEFLRKKFHGALKIPSAFLGYEDSLPGGIGDNSLLFLATRYARSVKRLQRASTEGVKKILIIDWLLRHPNDTISARQFRVVSMNTTTGEDLEQKQALKILTDTVDNLVKIAADLGVSDKLDGEQILSDLVSRMFPGSDKAKYLKAIDTADAVLTTPEAHNPKVVILARKLAEDITRRVFHDQMKEYNPPEDSDLSVLVLERKEKYAEQIRGIVAEQLCKIPLKARGDKGSESS